jgi:hypothetical protein
MAAPPIPVAIADDAAARIAKLGYQREFEQILDHARQTLPGLRQLRTTLEYNPALPDEEPSIFIWALRDPLPPSEGADLLEWHPWADWLLATFPPQVHLQFHLESIFGDTDGW